MKAVMLSCLRSVTSALVLAKTVYQSAWRTPDIQHLVPLRIHPPSPSLTALVRMPITSLPACGSLSPKALRWLPSAIGVRYLCFCSSLPAIMIGPVGSLVRSSIRAAVLLYLATSSMAIVRPRIPAPPPPYSVGMHRPRRPASRKTSNRSCGYSPVSSISRARGLTLSWAMRRTVDCSSASSSVRSKSMRWKLAAVVSDPLIGVVVVNYFGGERTIRCLEAVLKSTWPADRLRVVLVDNGSEDGYVDGLREQFGDRVQVMVSPRNLGFGGACNL